MKTALVLAVLLAVGSLASAQTAPAVGSLKVPAGPCGADKPASLVAAWSVSDAQGRAPGEPVSGRGVSLVEEAKAGFASRSFTFEAWLRWPEEAAGKFQPETIAEAQGPGWTWALTANETGCLQLTWGPGRLQFQVESDMSYDIIRPGRWYHLAVVCDAPAQAGPPRVMIFLTEEGARQPFCVHVERAGSVAPAEANAQARLAVGRSLAKPSTGPMRVGSAAFYAAALTPPDLVREQAPDQIPAEIIGKLPEGVSIDDELEMGSLGVYGQTSDGTILFTCAPRWMRNYWYAFRVRGAKGKTLTFQAVGLDAMMISPWVSEDGLAALSGPYGGMKWVKPNAFVHRRVNVPVGEPQCFSFAHTFSSDDALVAGSPMVVAGMFNAWLDEVAVKQLGAKIQTIGHSPDGKPLRVAEIGNPDAPLVWMQAGQHSAVERFGYHLITEAFERAAKDEELLKKTRWLILPVVNVDSYMVMPKPGDPNLNRVWRASDTHPTTSAIRRFLEQETARTGTLAAFDCHAGTVQRGNTLAMGGSVGGVFEKFLTEAGFVPVATRPQPWAAQPPPAPVDRANWHPGAESLTFNGFGSALPLARAAYTLELSTMAFRTPDGAGPASPAGMRRDGDCFYQALKKLIDAPMPPPATSAAPAPAGQRRGAPGATTGRAGRGGRGAGL